MDQWRNERDLEVVEKLRVIRERNPERFAQIERMISAELQKLERKFSATVP